MTVAELIAQLQQVDPSLEILSYTDYGLMRTGDIKVMHVEQIELNAYGHEATEYYGRQAVVI